MSHLIAHELERRLRELDISRSRGSQGAGQRPNRRMGEVEHIILAEVPTRVTHHKLHARTVVVASHLDRPTSGLGSRSASGCTTPGISSLTGTETGWRSS